MEGRSRALARGYVHLYEGDGKGKTTAAIGLAVRAAGQGMRVLFVQFLKGRDTGELSSLRRLGIAVLRGAESDHFLFQMEEGEKSAYLSGQRRCFLDSIRVAETYDLVVLDEVLDAVHAGAVSDGELLQWLRCRPAGLEVVLTGRNPSGELQRAADYYTYMEKRKHPFDRGATARKGVEY